MLEVEDVQADPLAVFRWLMVTPPALYPFSFKCGNSHPSADKYNKTTPWSVASLNAVDRYTNSWLSDGRYSKYLCGLGRCRCGTGIAVVSPPPPAAEEADFAGGGAAAGGGGAAAVAPELALLLLVVVDSSFAITGVVSCWMLN